MPHFTGSIKQISKHFFILHDPGAFLSAQIRHPKQMAVSQNMDPSRAELYTTPLKFNML